MTEPMDLAAREDNLRRALAHLEQYLYSETWAGVSDAGPVKELVEWALDGIALVRQQRAAIEALVDFAADGDFRDETRQAAIAAGQSALALSRDERTK